MSCCGGYHCWWKKKPRSSNDTAERPSIDPSVETAENPSTDPPDRSVNLPVETAKKTSLSTTSIGSSSSTKPPTTLEEVVSSFQKVNTARLDDFVEVIKQLLERVTAQKDTQGTSSTSSPNKDKLSVWASIFQSGKTFLSFVSDNTEKIDTKSGEATKFVGDILEQIGHLHWIVGTLSIIGYLISKCQKVSQNRTECVELLKDMLMLASHIKHLNILILENEKKEKKERLEKAFQYIIEGSMFCASQLDSGKFCSFLKTSIYSDTLSGIRSKIGDLYRDLQLTAQIQVLVNQTVDLPLSQPEYPKNAVGIEEQLETVNKLLKMETTEDCSASVVVIWGFGGIGKTTLARAVVSKIDRSRYNYARITLDEVSEKNKYTEMQQQILKDAFPNYMDGRKIHLRDNEDGKDKLREAFTSERNKAVFLYIDNALHVKDLENLLPEDLQGLPHHSRILITTRTMGIKDMLEERGFHDRVKDYPVKTLSDNDAMQILCKDSAIRDRIKDNLEKIVNVCKGIPLVLEIVGANLLKQKFDAHRCTRIIEDLKKGEEIKAKDLSDRLFHFVYKELEVATQEAFLDICCGIFDERSRQHVEYIVGAEEITLLQDAALITPVMVKSDEWEEVIIRSSRWPGLEEERLTVHDIIRSIGRRLGKSSRIVDANAWVEAEKDEARLKGIKIVRIDRDEGYILEERHLNSMKKTLRILELGGSINVRVADAVTLPELRKVRISGDISWLNVEALDKLAVLRCDKLPTKQTDLLRLPKSLRVIDIRVQPADLLKMVPDSSLEELRLIFEDNSESSNEEEYNSESSNEEEYNSVDVFNRFLPGLNNLKALSIMKCQSFCELPEQVCRLPQLSKLSLISCEKIERLPELFGQLTTVTYLNLAYCKGLETLPSTVGQLTNLTHLDLLWCESLKELPDTLGQLEALQHLNLFGCESLEKLPDTLGQLEALQHLNLFCCSSLEELPRGIEQLRSLKCVDLQFCHKLESDICQEDGSIKIVKRSLHSCSDCHRDKKLEVRV